MVTLQNQYLESKSEKNILQRYSQLRLMIKVSYTNHSYYNHWHSLVFNMRLAQRIIIKESSNLRSYKLKRWKCGHGIEIIISLKESSINTLIGFLCYKEVVLTEKTWLPLSVLPVQCRTDSVPVYVEKTAEAILTTSGVEENRWQDKINIGVKLEAQKVWVLHFYINSIGGNL